MLRTLCLLYTHTREHTGMERKLAVFNYNFTFQKARNASWGEVLLDVQRMPWTFVFRSVFYWHAGERRHAHRTPSSRSRIQQLLMLLRWQGTRWIKSLCVSARRHLALSFALASLKMEAKLALMARQDAAAEGAFLIKMFAQKNQLLR